MLLLVGCGGQESSSKLENGPKENSNPTPTGDREQQPTIRQVSALLDNVPLKSTDGGYTSSTVCRKCHESEFNSWHKTYHRTMTQVASPDAVVGDFNDVRLSKDLLIPERSPVGDSAIVRHEYFLQHRGDEYWAKLTLFDDRGRSFPNGDHQIVMTTGSHHYQMYWVSPFPDRTCMIFPFVYLIADRRWVTRESALVTPPGAQQKPVVWNGICIRCHSTHAQPRVDIQKNVSDTRVAELGISCEACHGPGEAHARAHEREDPMAPRLVHPKKLSAEKSSQVCGQCHAIATFKQRDWDKGYWNQFKPGDDLHQFRNVVQPTDEQSIAEVRQAYEREDPRFGKQKFGMFQDARFWSDGMVRVSGREYNAITQTKCFGGGDFSCLSCHSMHNYHELDDQLSPKMRGDRTCMQCHAKDIDLNRLEEHTHHPADSAGSRCYNCHMPHTTYGLLKAIRGHQVESPSVLASVKTGRPNGCSQCHLDKSLGWTQEKLVEWYPDTARVKLTDDEENVSATVLWLLKGDAGQRALAAWTVGWKDAKKASGEDWLAPYLSVLLEDPYPAVRYISARSLYRLEGYKDFEYDYVGSFDYLSAARKRALEQWITRTESRASKPDPATLIDDQGKLDKQIIERLLSERDNRPVDLAE